jgi:PKHD-type hydroxylase
MILKYNFWFWKKELSKKFCEDVINFHLQHKDFKPGITGTEVKKLEEGKKIEDKDIEDLHKQRNSNVTFSSEPWIINEISPYIDFANKNAEWNFELDWIEPLQFTVYNLNQHYNWHVDSWNEPYVHNNPNFDKKIRKLSFIISLQDENKYEGGDLFFDTNINSPDEKRKFFKCEELKPQGSIVVFPSHVWHKVSKVTKGLRYSLVGWVLGKPYK